jgi:poly(A) polymerase
MNKAKAQRLSAAYDGLEARISELAAQEELNKIRPDIDGNEIMAILGIPPGPLVGRAWAYLKELRMDRGPLDHGTAVAELLAWAAAAGLQVPPPPEGP